MFRRGPKHWQDSFLKKTAPRHSNIKGKKDRETERGAGEEKAWGKQGRQVVKINEPEKHDGIVPLQPQQIDIKRVRGSKSRHRNKLSWRVQRPTVLIPLDAEALQVPVACYGLLRRNNDGRQSIPPKKQYKQT